MVIVHIITPCGTIPPFSFNCRTRGKAWSVGCDLIEWSAWIVWTRSPPDHESAHVLSNRLKWINHDRPSRSYNAQDSSRPMNPPINQHRWMKIQRTIKMTRLFICTTWKHLSPSSMIGRSRFKHTDSPNDTSSSPLIAMNRLIGQFCLFLSINRTVLRTEMYP